ncbi:cd7 antigen-like [Tautogolabrus adspersus]
MSGIKNRACFYFLLFTLTGCVRADLQFLERNEGESVVLSCVVEKRDPSPFGVYLKRSWLHTSEVLFMHTKSDFSTNISYEKRTSVSGDPSSHVLNVTISQLRVSDTDRYFCEFHVPNHSSEDLHLKGNNEFFLLVHADTVSSMDFGLVETCAGSSAVLPCVPPRVEALAVEGVSLKRQRGRLAPVEVLYHSQHDRGNRGPISSSSSSRFPDERVQLSLDHGPGGITYNLTVLQLQPEDSALYSCTLLLRGLPDSSTRLGRQVFFVSVQAECGCSGYSTLLYAVSAAVAVLLFLVFLVGCVVFHQGKARRSVKSHPQAPIYEEMAGVHAESHKLAPYHLEEMGSSENKSSHVKRSCPENHYERPSGGPRRVSP